MSATLASATRGSVGEQAGASALQTARRGLALSPGLRIGLGTTVVLALVATAGRVVVPVAVQRVVDLIAVNTAIDLDAVRRTVLVAVLATGVTGACQAWMNVRLGRVSETALSDLRVRAFRHIHDLSMLHQAAQQRGQLVARVTSDIASISQFLAWSGVQLLVNAGQLAIALLVMFVYSWQLAVVALLSLLPFVLISRWFQRRLVVAYLDVRRKVGHMLAVLGEAVVGAPVVRAYGVEDHTQRRLDDAIEDNRAAGLRAGGLSAGYSGAGELFVGIASGAVVVAGTWLAVRGTLTVGTVLAFPFLIVLFLQPLQMAAEMLNEAQNAVAGWSRILDVLDTPPDVADPADGVALPDQPLDVRFDDVQFRYPRPGESPRTATGPRVLRDVEVTLRAHSHVAVVGETGSGKTTFAKLLTRLMDPTSGQVLLGGVPVDQVAFNSLRSRVVMVPQDDVLLDGSIAYNVAWACPGAGPDQVAEAFTTLGLGDWVAALPQGIHTTVGERGASLSAGERQLVSLARAYLTDPDILVLDEATSAVDPATEVRLQRAIAGLAQGRTTVTIAHRMSTAESADTVLVFDRGRLVERGAHADLVEAGGIYSALHASWVSGRSA